jgi:hypothetical protein
MSEGHDSRTLTFDEAEALAKAKRILQLDRHAIRYVKYDPHFFHDYCRVDVVFDGAGRGTMVFTLLPLSERQDGENFTDEHVKKVAKSGNVLDAIRLYRLLHSADLATAKLAVERMLQQHERQRTA